MVEMQRIKIVEENGKFFLVRKVRNEWIPIFDGRDPVSADDCDEAVILLEKFSKQ